MSPAVIAGGCVVNDTLGKNGGTVLGKMISRDLTVGLEIAPATIGVPVARAVVALQVFVRHLEGGGPCVELVAPLRIEIGAVVVDVAPAVAVGGDHDVALFTVGVDDGGVGSQLRRFASDAVPTGDSL